MPVCVPLAQLEVVICQGHDDFINLESVVMEAFHLLLHNALRLFCMRKVADEAASHVGGISGASPGDDKGSHAIDRLLVTVISIRVHKECRELLQLALAVRNNKL